MTARDDLARVLGHADAEWRNATPPYNYHGHLAAALLDPANLPTVLRALVEAGAQPDHFVTFAEDRWSVEHSLACRLAGTLGTCEFHNAIEHVTKYQADPDAVLPHPVLGRWRIVEVDEMGLPSLERAPLEPLWHRGAS